MKVSYEYVDYVSANYAAALEKRSGGAFRYSAQYRVLSASIDQRTSWVFTQRFAQMFASRAIAHLVGWSHVGCNVRAGYSEFVALVYNIIDPRCTRGAIVLRSAKRRGHVHYAHDENLVVLYKEVGPV